MVLLNDYEELLNQVYSEVPVIESPILLEKTGCMGLYRDGRIYLQSNQPLPVMKETLSEEYNHHKYTVGNIIDYNDYVSWKQELKARKHSIEMLISLDDLISCAKYECTNKYECAEFLDVTVEFFEDTILHYFNKYGVKLHYNDYEFIFSEESVQIKKM